MYMASSAFLQSPSLPPDSVNTAFSPAASPARASIGGQTSSTGVTLTDTSAERAMRFSM